MNNSFLTGAVYPFRGLALLTKPGIRFYAVVPLLINMVLFAIGVWYGYSKFQLFLDWSKDFLPSWLQWIEWLLIPLFVVTVGVAIFFTFSLMANVVAAPFNSILSERVEHHLRGGALGQEQKGFKEVLLTLVPLIWNELGKIAYNLIWTIPFLILFFIPVVNVAAPFLWLLFSAWIMAIQYADIPMGNHGLTGKEVRGRLKEQRVESYGFGGMTLLLTSIPFINFLVMPTAVAGATIMWVESNSGTSQKTKES